MSAMERWESDESLLDDLVQALAESPTAPPHVVQAAKAVFAWQSIDAELAALTYDSLLSDELVGVRDAAARVRSITFETDGISVELEVDASGVVGQILPPQPGTIAVRAAAGEVATVAADEVGHFVIRPFPVGQVSLRCSTAGGRSFVTSWVSY